MDGGRCKHMCMSACLHWMGVGISKQISHIMLTYWHINLLYISMKPNHSFSGTIFQDGWIGGELCCSAHSCRNRVKLSHFKSIKFNFVGNPHWPQVTWELCFSQSLFYFVCSLQSLKCKIKCCYELKQINFISITSNVISYLKLHFTSYI